MTSSKTALITGCSDGGIGSALAVVLQQRGYHVFATARDPNKMKKLERLPNVTMLKLDVTSRSDINAAVDAVARHTGGTLSCLINNAGRNHFMPMLDEDIGKLKDLYEVNVWGPLALAQSFAPLVIKSKGMMVFITSISGYINCPWMGR